MVGAQRKCAVQVERPVSARNGHSGAGGGAYGLRCARRPSRRRVFGHSVYRAAATIALVAAFVAGVCATSAEHPLRHAFSDTIRSGCAASQSVEDRRQHHHVHVARLGQGWVGTDRYAARIRSHHYRTESPPGPRGPGTRRRAAPYRWRPGAPRRRRRPCIRPEQRWRGRNPAPMRHLRRSAMNRGALAGPYLLRRTKFLRRERSDHEHRRRHHLQHNDGWRQ